MIYGLLLMVHGIWFSFKGSGCRVSGLGLRGHLAVCIETVRHDDRFALVFRGCRVRPLSQVNFVSSFEGQFRS